MRVIRKAVAAAVIFSLAISGAVLPADRCEAVSSGRQDMYRLYNYSSGEHFYTANSEERDSLRLVGWGYEGIGWVAPVSSDTPVYRLYNVNSGDHHYTANEAEKNQLVLAGWNDEGIGWYSDDSKLVPLYREYNSHATAGSHNYTTSTAEHDALAVAGWSDEGIGWYALEAGREDNTAAPLRTPAGSFERIKNIVLGQPKDNEGNHSLIEEENGSSLRVSYIEKTETLRFRFQSISDGFIMDVIMDCSVAPSRVAPGIIITFKNGQSVRLITNAQVATYNANTDTLDFSVDTGVSVYDHDLKNACNGSLRMSFAGWDYMLETIGTSMREFGFSSYTGYRNCPDLFG